MNILEENAQLLAEFVQACINRGFVPICSMHGQLLTDQQREVLGSRSGKPMNAHEHACQVCRMRWILSKGWYLDPRAFPLCP